MGKEILNPKVYERLLEKSRQLIDLPQSDKLHFSFILRGKKILSLGVNRSFKTHRLAKKYGARFAAMHSELSAILNFPFPPYRLSECVLVNIRLNKAGEPVMARPCGACQTMLNDFRFHQVFYTNEVGELVCLMN